MLLIQKSNNLQIEDDHKVLFPISFFSKQEPWKFE